MSAHEKADACNKNTTQNEHSRSYDAWEAGVGRYDHHNSQDYEGHFSRHAAMVTQLGSLNYYHKFAPLFVRIPLYYFK